LDGSDDCPGDRADHRQSRHSGTRQFRFVRKVKQIRVDVSAAFEVTAKQEMKYNAPRQASATRFRQRIRASVALVLESLQFEMEGLLPSLVANEKQNRGNGRHHRQYGHNEGRLAHEQSQIGVGLSRCKGIREDRYEDAHERRDRRTHTKDDRVNGRRSRQPKARHA
jgi:hypothetical protein